MRERRSAGVADFPLLDALRGLAAIGVLTYHVGLQTLAINGGPWEPFARPLAHAEAGIAIFFALSGFLLYRPYAVVRLAAVAGERARRPGFRDFFIRRALRIVPGYYVALVLVALWLGREEVWDRPLVYFGFLQVYSGDWILGGIGQAWTIGTEIAFYLLVPVLVLALGRARARTVRAALAWELAALAALFAISVAWKLVALARWGDAAALEDLPLFLTLPAFLDHFAIGMALAAVSAYGDHPAGRLPGPLAAMSARPAIPVGAAIAAYAVSSWGIGMTGLEPKTDPQYLVQHALFQVMAVGLMIPAIWGAGGRYRRVLGSRPLLFAGLVSYGFYLYHLAVLRQLLDWGVGTAAGGVALYATALGGSLLLGFVSWRVVERPALRLKRRLRERGRPLEATEHELRSGDAAAGGVAGGVGAERALSERPPATVGSASR